VVFDGQPWISFLGIVTFLRSVRANARFAAARSKQTGLAQV
jgi:hypothetical protein